jgi:hypothetical protein
MAGNYSISWDEENSPQGFAWCWAINQCIVLLAGLLVKTHVLPSMALMQRDHPRWERIFGFFVYLLATLSLYLNLTMNGFWHRNVEASAPDEDDPENLEISVLNPQADAAQTAKNTSPALFEQSLLKNPDPIVLRDQIQWKRMLLATVGAGTLAVSFVML